MVVVGGKEAEREVSWVAVRGKAPETKRAHGGNAFHLIFNRRTGGLALKVENENDFQPQSPLKCAEPKYRPAWRSLEVQLKQAQAQTQRSELDSGTRIYTSEKQAKIPQLCLCCVDALLKIDTQPSLCAPETRGIYYLRVRRKAGSPATKWIVS